MSKKRFSELSRSGRHKFLKSCREIESEILTSEDEVSEILPSTVPRLSDTRGTNCPDIFPQRCDENSRSTPGFSPEAREPIPGGSAEIRSHGREHGFREKSDEFEDDSSDNEEMNVCMDENNEGYEESDDQDDSQQEEQERSDQEEGQEELESVVSDNDADNDQGREQQPRRNADNPLYTGAPITVAQSMLLILTMFLKHNMTGSCLSDIILVINYHCLSQGLKKNSLYKFKKYFAMIENNYEKHYYCSACLTSLNSERAICTLCTTRKGVSYFIQMPFLRQLEEMLERKGFYDLLQHRFRRNDTLPNTYSDVYDGSLYKTYTDNGFLSNPNNISLSWNTDGVPVFQSSKISMWPVFFTINELPYKYRMKRENTLLAGLWFGNKKPAANNFIYKLRPDFEKLFRGTNCTLPGGNVINVKGILLAGTCDLPAKAEFLNFVAHNGKSGCPNCKNSGETFTHSTGGISHVYHYEREPQMRTTAETLRNGNQALQDGKPVNGVKGPCAFSKIMPDFIAGVAIDCMHCVFCGVTKRLLSLWFDSSFRGCPFSLSTVSAIIDAKLIQIKPPKFVHRMPRSVADLCHWKASELRMWFYYYSAVILEGIMRPDYFQHYLCLVTGISILNSECITQNQLEIAKNMLHKFVRDFEILYGLRFCTINIHQLIHLPTCVERLGPLWGFSCFPFESLNGQLLKLVHGTSHIDSQVARAHTYFLNMKSKLDELPEGPIRDFALGFKHQVKICEYISSGCYSVGTYEKPNRLPAFIEQAMISSGIMNGNVNFYKRLLKDSKLYVAEMYTRSLQTSSSHVVYNANYEKNVGSVHCFLKISNCDCVIPCMCEGQHYAIISEIVIEQSYQACGDHNVQVQLSYLHKCSRSDRKVIAPLTALESVCVYICIDNQSYVGMPVNRLELE